MKRNALKVLAWVDVLVIANGTQLGSVMLFEAERATRNSTEAWWMVFSILTCSSCCLACLIAVWGEEEPVEDPKPEPAPKAVPVLKPGPARKPGPPAAAAAMVATLVLVMVGGVILVSTTSSSNGTTPIHHTFR